ncbi:MAG TPA: histidine phosphatase family protein [Candidatus Saccharimonadales bacterium]|nr:histidine phosphatase family protein [Candidatus Saccharimonadales bacterium]
MKKLYFIRHGESVSNVERWHAGRIDTPLTERGRQQAREAGKKAKAQKLHFDLIVSSPLSRALETARIIAKEIGYPEKQIKTNPLLVERNYGAMAGKPWAADIDFDGVIDAETSDELSLRAKEIISWLNQIEVDSILVVCHGSIGRTLRFHLLKEKVFDPEGKMPNAEIMRWI